jgi:RNA polymerase sigma-70 factor (ECF subfamily)
LELVADEFRNRQGHLKDQRQALRFCLEKLPTEQKALIGKRYNHGRKIRDIAEELDRPAKIVYRLFDKIRKALFECVSTRMAQEAV